MKVAQTGAYQGLRATTLADCIMAALSTQRTIRINHTDGALSWTQENPQLNQQ